MGDRYYAPGWTPLFLNVTAMAMEVGGLTTHGSYGISWVASVAGARSRIRSDQRIRVDGDRGTVELLSRRVDKAFSHRHQWGVIRCGGDEGPDRRSPLFPSQ
jgi:hypothetical protein